MEEKVIFHSAKKTTRMEYDFSHDKALVGSTKLQGIANRE